MPLVHQHIKKKICILKKTTAWQQTKHKIWRFRGTAIQDPALKIFSDMNQNFSDLKKIKKNRLIKIHNITDKKKNHTLRITTPRTCKRTNPPLILYSRFRPLGAIVCRVKIQYSSFYFSNRCLLPPRLNLGTASITQ